MPDHMLEEILAEVSKKEQIYRIRIGTRTPVVLPMRWTQTLLDIVSRFHEPGKREIAVVTHFEHSYEITPEVRDTIQKKNTAKRDQRLQPTGFYD
jgi:lysine 2,3-aminomutase